MKKAELEAIFNLLEDPDDFVYESIKNKLADMGVEVIPFLEDLWEQTINPVLQRKIENIIHYIQFQQLKNDFIDWKNSESNDLQLFSYLISRYKYPDLDKVLFDKRILNIYRDIWIEINQNLTSIEKIQIINRIIYDYYDMGVDRKNFFDPSYFFLSHLLESKKGNAMSIGMLYLILCEKLNISVYGVDLPNFFILCYTDEEYIEISNIPDENHVLFYINPFNKGLIFGRKAIEEFLQQSEIEPESRYFKPMSHLETASRYIKELAYSYKHTGDLQSYEELIGLYKILF